MHVNSITFVQVEIGKGKNNVNSITFVQVEIDKGKHAC